MGVYYKLPEIYAYPNLKWVIRPNKKHSEANIWKVFQDDSHSGSGIREATFMIE